jgi:hypothetical protein
MRIPACSHREDNIEELVLVGYRQNRVAGRHFRTSSRHAIPMLPYIEHGHGLRVERRRSCMASIQILKNDSYDRMYISLHIAHCPIDDYTTLCSVQSNECFISRSPRSEDPRYIKTSQYEGCFADDRQVVMLPFFLISQAAFRHTPLVFRPVSLKVSGPNTLLLLLLNFRHGIFSVYGSYHRVSSTLAC